MPAKKQIHPDEKVPLKLTARERKLIRDELLVTGMEYEELLNNTPTGKPLMMTLDDLDDFSGYIAAEANHCDDKKTQKKLDAILLKIQDVFDDYTDEEPPQTANIANARKDKLISDQAVQFAEWAAQSLVAAGQLRIKTKPIGQFPLQESERAVLALLPIRPNLKNKLLKDSTNFTVSEVAGMAMAVAEQLPDSEPKQQVALLMVSKSLMDCLQDRLTQAAQPALASDTQPKSKATAKLFQFKITLLESAPPIWRRIQVQDCTLDKLHEHIQTAMGWTNSHLHQFEINGETYGDPGLLDDGFEDFECIDSTVTKISEVVPKSGKRFVFKYEYDFGDSWEHEVLFEGCPEPEKGKKYPLCIEGERACPPEDVGGVWGYQDFLSAIADPDHEEHENFLEWCGGSFSPDTFDPQQATKAMKDGLPDWKIM